MPSLQSQDIRRRSATTTQPPNVREHVEVAKLIDISRCIGCKACQAACLEWNDLREEVGHNDGTYNNPHDLTDKSWTVMRFTETEETGRLEWLIRKDGCMHCAVPGCLKACPAPGAIVQYNNGIVDFVSENCIGCGYCIRGCPFDIPRLSSTDHKVYKCTLCSDRVAVGQAPACAKVCPTQAISYGSKADMIHWADQRITELKRRGFADAGLYDPPGVGGTHVMYVLQHADRPELYADLPKDPQISSLLEVWKGPTKSLSLAAVGMALVGAFFHYVTTTPVIVDEKDEEHARQLDKESRQ